MAKTVYDEVEVALQDGTAVTLKPLSIGKLKKFMTAWKEGFTDVDEEKYEHLDAFIECCGICLDRELASKVDKRFGDDKKITDEYREYLEDVLDMDTIYKVIQICGGIDFNDPNLVAAARAATEADGTP